ncbi:YunG family protein [Mycolicibacterium tusciae]|uniref:YunG family protein n=1 Tax=Mycolicibacterium tusciae TaxID=75922 RepID=UPI003C6E6A44
MDYHRWNSLPRDREIDFTRGQFNSTESVVGGQAIPRPTTPGRLQAQYEALQRHVAGYLDQAGATGGSSAPGQTTACATNTEPSPNVTVDPP